MSRRVSRSRIRATLGWGLLMLGWWTLPAWPAGGAPPGADAMVVLENGLVSISFSPTDGSVTGLEDKARGIAYLDGKAGPPFRLDTGRSLDTAFESFSWRTEADLPRGAACTLTWTIADGLVLEARVELSEGSDEIVFTSALANRGTEAIAAVEYPIIGGIRSIGADDALVHSFATGLLVHNPLRAFSFDGDGLRFMPYPESFSGASMQFFAYFRKGTGGLYFAAYDSAYHQKWLNCYRMGGRLEASLMYGYEDMGPGKGCSAPYRFVVKTFAGDDWYEAADLYKVWAVRQPWCAQGTLVQRGADRSAPWLLEKVGVSTFGINASYDRVKWIERYHEDVGTPVFHVLGPDWPKVDQTFYRGIPGGMADWFPTRFSKANLDAIRRLGDYVVPFEFDFLVDPNKSDGARLRRNLQVFPPTPRSFDAYAFTMLCPVTEFTRTFHVERDVRVIEEAGVDGMYYDISANNLITTCLSPDHGHPVGGGSVIAQAYQRAYEETRQAISAAAGRYLPLGTEMMCEAYLPQIDFYQARAWAQPAAAFETGSFHGLMKSGQAEMVPLFTYVYHEYGPQRLDGWGKLVTETGELFHHIVAKTYLWGGLYEINHEYSPMEALDGAETKPAEHYFPFDPQGYAYDASRAAYVAQFAALRTGAANRYLAYGTMLRPLDLGLPAVRMSWFHYNCNQKWREYRDRGTIAVSPVVHSAWRYGDGAAAAYAFLFANTTGKEVTVRAKIDGTRYGMTAGGWAARLVGGFGKDRTPTEAVLGPASAEGVFTLDLPIAPRAVCMVEIARR